jgi:hypothetical protein
MTLGVTWLYLYGLVLDWLENITSASFFTVVCLFIVVETCFNKPLHSNGYFMMLAPSCTKWRDFRVITVRDDWPFSSCNSSSIYSMSWKMFGEISFVDVIPYYNVTYLSRFSFA